MTSPVARCQPAGRVTGGSGETPVLKGRTGRSHRDPELAGSCSAAKQEPIALLRGIVVRLVGLLWEGKCWNSWPVGSRSTMQNVFKGLLLASCLTSHIPHQVSSQAGRKKTCEHLQVGLS